MNRQWPSVDADERVRRTPDDASPRAGQMALFAISVINATRRHTRPGAQDGAAALDCVHHDATVRTPGFDRSRAWRRRVRHGDASIGTPADPVRRRGFSSRDGPLVRASGSPSSSANNIGRITTDGTITEYALPTPAAGPVGITTGPDGALWFTEQFANNIGRISTGTAPTITEIEVPSPAGIPESIATGADGALWFTERENRQLGRIVPEEPARVTEFARRADASGPTALTSSCDGRLWFAAAGRRGRRVRSDRTEPVPTLVGGVGPRRLDRERGARRC